MVLTVTRRIVFSFAVVAVLAAIAPAASQDGDVPLLVSTDWVAEHLEDPDVRLVHVAMLEMAPPEAFIPGASVLDYHSIETSEGLAIELPSPQQLVSVFRASGVSNDKHVVLYGGGAAHIAARAFVTLEYLSHPRVSVMDGGIQTWLNEGRPTVSEPTEATPGDFVPKINTDVLADAAWILERLDDPSIAVIDARPASQYAGRSNRGLREGHIPGAGNIYFVELLESEDVPRLKPRHEAEALFAAAGAEPGDTIVSYCQIGMRASYNYLIARHLGYDVKFYDQSWQEWGADESLPARTGSGR
jgi:thiosulfate/3-mercaptopyruvate sulfurtransferase